MSQNSTCPQRLSPRRRKETESLSGTRLTRVPPVDRHVVFELIEAQIGAGEHFGQHDDLTGVHREVFGDVEDGFEDVDIVALDFATLEECFGIEGFEGGLDFGER